MRNKFSGGFVLAEFAIALPLLILLGSALAFVGIKIFEVGKSQLADYTLETDAQYIIEQITRESRTAKEVEITDVADKIQQLKIVYKTVGEHTGKNNIDEMIFGNDYPLYRIADVWETRFFIPHKVTGEENFKLYSKRKDDENITTPIAGNNTIGETKINRLQYKLYEDKKILHVMLELESLVTGRKIKLSTAVFMPSYGS